MILRLLCFWYLLAAAVEEDDKGDKTSVNTQNTQSMSRIMRRSEDTDVARPLEMIAVDANAHLTEVKLHEPGAANNQLSPSLQRSLQRGPEGLRYDTQVQQRHGQVEERKLEVGLRELHNTEMKPRQMHSLSQPAAMMQKEGQTARVLNSSVAGRKKVALDSTAVVQSKNFAEELIAQERETLCPDLPSKVKLEILAANTKIAEELIYVFRAKLTTSPHSIPNQAVEILRTGIEVEWMQNPAATTNDEQSAFARAEETLQANNSRTEPLTRGAKLVLPLSACDLMSVTFFLMCNRSKIIPAPREGASLSELEDTSTKRTSLRQMRESYLGLPGGLGVIIDKEVEAYERGLKQRAKAPGNLMELGARRSYPASFSWLYERPECLDYVHHQGTCGACYMFAALDSLSDRHCIDETKASTLGKIDHLSIQMALLCEPLGRQCSGGWADVGFNYSKYYGLVTSTDWPYERSCLSDSECQFGKQCFSPSSYACPGFFTQEELNEVVTFSDALRVTKRRCDNSNLVDPDNCKVWAEMMFAFSPTMVFMPESCFCDELEADWAKFAVRQSQVSHHGDGSGMTVLLQEQLREDEEGFNFFTWLYNLFTGGPHEENTTKTEAQTGSKDTWNSDIPGGQWGSEEKKTSTVTTETPSISTADQCNRDRCLTEPQVHKSTEYHYVLNHKDAFKEEILKDGPLYTSFFCLRGLHLVLHVLARAGLQLPMGRYAGWPCCGAHWLGERLHLPRGQDSHPRG